MIAFLQKTTFRIYWDPVDFNFLFLLFNCVWLILWLLVPRRQVWCSMIFYGRPTLETMWWRLGDRPRLRKPMTNHRRTMGICRCPWKSGPRAKAMPMVQDFTKEFVQFVSGIPVFSSKGFCVGWNWWTWPLPGEHLLRNEEMTPSARLISWMLIS